MFFYGVLLLVQVARSTQPDIELSFMNTHFQQLLPSDRTDTMGVLYFSGIGALLSLAIAGGLWFLKDPARWGLLMLAGAPIVRGFFQAASIIATDSGKLWTAMGDLFWFELFAYALLLLYLFRPDVQMAFGRHDRYAGAFDPGQGKPEEYDYDRER
jgi:hypothetical protein